MTLTTPRTGHQHYHRPFEPSKPHKNPLKIPSRNQKVLKNQSCLYKPKLDHSDLRKKELKLLLLESITYLPCKAPTPSVKKHPHRSCPASNNTLREVAMPPLIHSLLPLYLQPILMKGLKLEQTSPGLNEMKLKQKG